MQDIISVSREKTAKWIPNAIQISTNSEKVKFRDQRFYIPVFFLFMKIHRINSSFLKNINIL